jgi:hypothetical protein
MTGNPHIAAIVVAWRFSEGSGVEAFNLKSAMRTRTTRDFISHGEALN